MPRPAMTYEQIGSVLARAMRDRTFRDQLVHDPVKALAHEAYGVGKEAEEFFKSLDDKVFTVAASRHLAKIDAVGLASDMEA